MIKTSMLTYHYRRHQPEITP